MMSIGKDEDLLEWAKNRKEEKIARLIRPMVKMRTMVKGRTRPKINQRANMRQHILHPFVHSVTVPWHITQQERDDSFMEAPTGPYDVYTEGQMGKHPVQ